VEEKKVAERIGRAHSRARFVTETVALSGADVPIERNAAYSTPPAFARAASPQTLRAPYARDDAANSAPKPSKTLFFDRENSESDKKQ